MYQSFGPGSNALIRIIRKINLSQQKYVISLIEIYKILYSYLLIKTYQNYYIT